MRISRRAFAADEELGKKDDDHRPAARAPSLRPAWKAPRRRRIVLAFVGFYLLYIFFKNMPTDLTPAVERYNPELAQLRQKGRTLQSSLGAIPQAVNPHQPPPRENDDAKDNAKYYYEGKVRFYNLAKSLRPNSPSSHRQEHVSRAVLFAGADLKSVADLLPLACEMVRQGTNEVHFALMGRDDVSIPGIQKVNGISDEDCPIQWHDARPDYAPWSTGPRMERAVRSGLGYIREYINPQVVITHGEFREESFFWKAIKQKTDELGLAHIPLSRPAVDLMWLSKLDSGSLKVWNKMQIEMLVHAPSESSGSLIRLLKSLEGADYLDSVPSLTIELPPRVDPELLRFLQNTNWPPQSSSKVTLRRRIPSQRMTSEMSSIRTVEAFYPRDPNVTHVLVLSPQTELSPSFFHFLKYTALNYKHSVSAMNVSSELLGISLELPSSRPTDNEPFAPPSEPMDVPQSHDGEQSPFFLWQVPDSNAALYFGDKWAEFHSFLSHRLSAPGDSHDLSPKLISKKYPAFMEYLLEFMRVRGYYMLYPSFSGRNHVSLATVHNELYHPPEEFIADSSSALAEADKDAIEDLPEVLSPSSDLELGSVERPLFHGSTVEILLQRFPDHLPKLEALPLLSYKSEKLSARDIQQRTSEFAREFRTKVGGCKASNTPDDAGFWKIGDYFCL
ncbi:hypothetical protein DTO027B5_7254 [Paecilomyces variotii]|nr:hypothetical protein DTO021C3_9115 [Paecilomyces variotii]KAJ9328530.1 hypothetical protein DTO027B3_796 [Paecilomyces variotii]KAJ9330941.1 hypothetical protein DTO027B5_7254 [Paecilomyces variotii]KAJ9398541.1 hypothetical protein DTO282F9_4632 [Paecilomyces variotii]